MEPPKHLQICGPERQERYWTLFEQLRTELGYADYLGALQRYRVENPRDPHILEMSSYLLDYPFANRLYPGSLDAIAHCQQWGPCVILSDGDVVFQPRKVERAGLWEAVDGRVAIAIPAMIIGSESNMPMVSPPQRKPSWTSGSRNNSQMTRATP